MFQAFHRSVIQMTTLDLKLLSDASRDYMNIRINKSVKVLPKYRVLALNLVLLESTNGITVYRNNDRI